MLPSSKLTISTSFLVKTFSERSMFKNVEPSIEFSETPFSISLQNLYLCLTYDKQTSNKQIMRQTVKHFWESSQKGPKTFPFSILLFHFLASKQCWVIYFFSKSTIIFCKDVYTCNSRIFLNSFERLGKILTG